MVWLEVQCDRCGIVSHHRSMSEMERSGWRVGRGKREPDTCPACARLSQPAGQNATPRQTHEDAL